MAGLFVPFTFFPFALNVDGDVGSLFMEILRLIDTNFHSWTDPNFAYANPIIQIITNFHGVIRPLFVFPLIYILDLVGVHFTEMSTGILFLVIGFTLIIFQYGLLKRIIGARQAWLFSLLFAFTPYFILQMKAGWWHLFTYPPLAASLVFLHLFLQEETMRRYRWFCIALSLYMLSDPGFFLGGIIILLYPLVWFNTQTGSIKEAIYEIYRRAVATKWSLLPLGTLFFLIAIPLIGHFGFGSEIGTLARAFDKQSRLMIPTASTIIYSFVQGMGVVGWLFFPALIGASFWGIIRVIKKKSSSPLFTAAVISFWLTFLLINFAGGAAGALYLVYIPGLLILTQAFFALPRSWMRFSCAGFLIAVTYAQSILYNTQFTPPSIFQRPFSSIHFFSSATAGEPCEALWCPWHFGEPKNLGITTAAFVIRDYMGFQPIPFISMQENYYIRPKEIFFYNHYQKGPSFSIGRRISYNIEDLEEPKVILAFTDELLNEIPRAGDRDVNKQVLSFIQNHPEYHLTAAVTKDGTEIIKIFEKHGTLEYRLFAIEEYDKKFHDKYSTLRGLGHIDL